LSVDDALTILAAFRASAAEGLALGDSVAGTVGGGFSATDGVSVGDSLDADVNYDGVISDGVAFGDNAVYFGLLLYPRRVNSVRANFRTTSTNANARSTRVSAR
jgi:hypothetical protein